MVILNHNLRLFIEVAEMGSITQTATKLYVSQPAISKAIKNLEEELNVKLFHRNKRTGLILTDIGHEILIIARQMQELENLLYQTTYKENNFMGGKLKIASMPILTSVFLSPVLYEFKKRYPKVSIELIEGSSIEIRKAVEEHQVDFAIASEPFDDLDFQVIFTDKMLAISKQPFQLDIIDIHSHTDNFILCRAGQETILEKHHLDRIPLEKSFIVEQAETVISLVENNNGIGILSQLVLDNTPNQLYRLPIIPKIEIKDAIIANSLDDLTPVAMEMKRMIIEYIHKKDEQNKFCL